ncbi:MAG: N-acetyltransferase family protein [Betaproteobacteria bacterium]
MSAIDGGAGGSPEGVAPPAGVVLRVAQAGDCAAIAAIYAHHVRTGSASFELEAPDASEIAHRHRDVVDLCWPYLVAERDSEVVGYAYASPYRARPAYRFAVEDSVYVRADCAGRGIGRALLDLLIVQCAARGARQMIAATGDSANVPSIRLHTAAGFVPAGTLRTVGWKFERWLDVVLMQRPLGPGAGAPAERSPG